MPGTCTSSENMKEMGRTVTERQKGYRGEACRAVSPSVTPQLVRLQGWRGTGGAMGRPRKFRSNLSCTHSLAPLWDCSCPAELPKTRLSGPCAKGVPTARDAWRHAEDLEVDQGGTQAGGTTLGGGSSVPRHCLSRGESASRVVSEGGGTRLGSGPGFRRVSRLWRRAPSAAPTSLGTLTRRGEDVAVLGPAHPLAGPTREADWIRLGGPPGGRITCPSLVRGRSLVPSQIPAPFGSAPATPEESGWAREGVSAAPRGSRKSLCSKPRKLGQEARGASPARGRREGVTRRLLPLAAFGPGAGAPPLRAPRVSPAPGPRGGAVPAHGA